MFVFLISKVKQDNSMTLLGKKTHYPILVMDGSQSDLKCLKPA